MVDTQFVVGETTCPLTDDTAVLVNGWQPHSYVHVPERPRTVILALYIEPEWLQIFRPGWVASGGPGFFSQPFGQVSAQIRRLAMDLAAEMMTRPDRKAAQEIISEAMRLADIALPTFPDEQALFGDTNAEACAERLISLGVKEVVVKDGTEPALVAAGGEQTLVPAVFANAVDTTGAGDSFNGAYLVARMERLSPVEAAQKAHAVAARVVETRGALTPMETARAAYAG